MSTYAQREHRRVERHFRREQRRAHHRAQLRRDGFNMAKLAHSLALTARNTGYVVGAFVLAFVLYLATHLGSYRAPPLAVHAYCVREHADGTCQTYVDRP